MATNVHPSSSELLVALHEPDQAASTLDHLDECLACRVRLSRIRRAAGLAPASADSLQRIVQATTPLPDVLANVISSGQDRQPQPNEIWRVGRSEALLVWVRQVFDDEVADVIPLVLDVELADQDSVIVGAKATPLAAETAAMVSLRTHVHIGAFLNRIGILDIRKDVAEVMTAMREGRRPSGIRVGPPIDDDDDQRIEYRQALRDLLAEFSPSAWLSAQHDVRSGAEQIAGEPTANCPSNEIDVIKSDLGERLPGVQCHDVKPHTVAVDTAVQVMSVLKVVYLDTTILVAILHGEHPGMFPGTRAIAVGLRRITLIENDADAVAVAIPADDWPALLFTTAHMRDAVELPGGAYTGPTVTLEGYGLVDTLCKHLEGVMPVWEITEQASNRIGRTDLYQIAVRHASVSIEQIRAEGKRAHQAAKRTAWKSLPDGLDQRVARFVAAVTNNRTINDALAELDLEKRDD